MTANVITYRGKSAAREIGKALSFDCETLERLTSLVSAWEYKSENDTLARHFKDAGLDLMHPQIRKFLELCVQFQDLPRHLGQHSGGMVAVSYTHLFESAGADAGFQNAFEIAALAVAGGSSSRRDRENYAAGGSGAAAFDAAWIICTQFSGPGKTGVDRGAAGEIGRQREYRFAGIDGYASSGGIPDEQVFCAAE